MWFAWPNDRGARSNGTRLSPKSSLPRRPSGRRCSLSTFSLGMIADYMDSLTTYGAGFYRNLFWEAGMVGQVLYLEAEG